MGEHVDLPKMPRADRLLLLVLLAVALVRGAVYAALIPPWLPNDEHGHFEYAWLVRQYGLLVGPDAISPEMQQRVLQSMYDHDYWYWSRQPTPDALPNGFTDPDDPWLRYSRPQVGDERPLYYWVVGMILRFVGPDSLETMLYLGRAVSILCYAGAVGLTFVTSRLIFPKSSFMKLVPTAFVLFLPMLGQVGAAVSSDSLGVLAVTGVFYSWAFLFRTGLRWKSIPNVLATTAVALLAKKTAVFVALLLPVGWLMLRFSRGVKLSRKLVARLGAVVAILVAALGVLLVVPGSDASGWLQWRLVEGAGCGPTRLTGIARTGEASLRVGPCVERHLTQVLPQSVLVESVGSTVVLRGWARSQAGNSQALVYILDTNGRSEVELQLTEDWQAFELVRDVASVPRYMVARAAWEGPGSAVILDDLSLAIGQTGANQLVNGSGEEAKSALMALAVRATRLLRVPDRVVERLLSAETWRLSSLSAHVTAFRFAFRSFWGFFGSMSLALPDRWYSILSVLSWVSAASVIVSVVVRSETATRLQSRYLFFAISGVVLLLVQTFLPILGMMASDWLPQGRYLFPGVMPTGLLVAWAWYRFLPRSWRRPAQWCVGAAFLALDIACLLLILSHFHLSVA